MCLGLLYFGAKNREFLVSLAIESGRITHNHPVAFFGAVASAVFTAFAIEGIPITKWGKMLLQDVMPIAHAYLKKNGRDWDNYQNNTDYNYFEV